MSEEKEQFDSEQQSQTGDAIASELASSMASSGSEEEFVATEEKPTVNKNSLVLFGIILLGLGGYYFMYARTGPKSAAASSVEAATAEQTIKTFLANGDQNVKSMEKMIKNTEQIVQQFKNDPSAKQIPLADLSTNPFQFVPLRASAPSDDGSRQFQLDKEAALRIIEGMQLQSTVVNGNRNACMINNTLYTEGQQVEGMTIEKITSTSVIFRSGTHRFQKTMSK